jgi:hypothetical protein
MTISADPELQSWSEDWQASAAPADLPEVVRAHVRRRSLLLAFWLLGEALVGFGSLIFLLYYAVTQDDAFQRVSMGLLAAVDAGALAFASSNWRGAWAPRAETTASFLELSFERARRLRRAVRVGWLILAGEVTVFVPWVWYRAGEGSLLWPWSFLGGMVALAILFLVLVDAWARREIETLEALADEISDSA